MSVTNNEIVNTAKSYKGKLKYEFGSDDIAGGTGDCSSFTEHVFSVHGVDIGADTGAQYTMGYAIEKEAIKAGDLIFFKDTYNSGKVDGVSHVGIAINANQFIHLSNSGCVISNLNNSYYASHYLGAKRLREISYEGVTHEEETITETAEPTSDIGLKWWGDIVKVAVIVIVLVGGVALLSMSLLGSVKTPKLDLIKGVTDNE